MGNSRSIVSKKLVIVGISVFLVITVAAAFGYRASQNDIRPSRGTEIAKTGLTEESSAEDRDVSKLILSVKNMSCSGCISTIKGSLSDIRGIKDILVDISSGKTEVYFDHKTLKDVSRVAAAITASGYPAEVLSVLSPERLKEERGLAAAKSQYYIASVGGWDVSRTDFNNELEIAKKRFSTLYGDTLFETAQGKALMDKLKVQIISKLINEGILMQEILKSGFKVDGETIEKELNVVLQEQGKNLEEFRKSLGNKGYDFSYFKKKFETTVLINTYLNERILADASNQFERQNLFTAWFNNSKVLAEVVYYDKDLQVLLQTQNASSSCCPTK